MMKRYSLNEDTRLAKLPVRYSDNLTEKIEDVISYNRFEKENLDLWLDSLIGLVSWLSNPVIAWDNNNDFIHYDNEDVFIKSYGILFRILTDKDELGAERNFVYVIDIVLSPQNYNLNVPSYLTENNSTKIQYNMKQRIRLTEGDLHRIIRKCVNEAYGSPTITDDIANCNLHRYWSPINNRIYDSPFQDTNKMLKKIDDLSYEIESIIRRDLTKYGVEYKHNAYVEKLIELANKMRPLIPYILNSLAQYTGEQPNGADSYHKEHLARKHTPYRNQYQHKFLRK